MIHLVWGIVAALLFALGGSVGWYEGAEHKQAALTQQTVGAATCVDASGAQQEVIKRYEAEARAERDERKRQADAIDVVLKDRDAEIAKLRETASNHRNRILEAANADDDCKPLAAVPVCAAIADGLWPVVPDAAGSGHSP
ncbi:MAG: hypothetical protein ABI843_02335 [Dokdonella sp.]